MESQYMVRLAELITGGANEAHSHGRLSGESSECLSDRKFGIHQVLRPDPQKVLFPTFPGCTGQGIGRLPQVVEKGLRQGS